MNITKDLCTKEIERDEDSGEHGNVEDRRSFLKENEIPHTPFGLLSHGNYFGPG